MLHAVGNDSFTGGWGQKRAGRGVLSEKARFRPAMPRWRRYRGIAAAERCVRSTHRTRLCPSHRQLSLRSPRTVSLRGDEEFGSVPYRALPQLE